VSFTVVYEVRDPETGEIVEVVARDENGIQHRFYVEAPPGAAPGAKLAAEEALRRRMDSAPGAGEVTHDLRERFIWKPGDLTVPSED